MPFSRPTLRGHLAGLLVLLLLGACDDPAQVAKDVVSAKGNCAEDSLRVSSESCVQMFQSYAEMATKAIHTYIGGMKAMDQALKRMPPANFDTAGLGHAFSLRPDSAGGLLASRAGGTGTPGAPSFSRSAANGGRYYPSPARGAADGYDPSDPGGGWSGAPGSGAAPDDWGDPYGPYDPYGRSAPYGPADPYSRSDPYGSAPYSGSDPRYSRDPRGLPYASPDAGDDWEYDAPPRASAPPTSPPGVVRPPSERLDRPWLRQRYPQRPVDPRYRPAPQ